MGLFTVNHSEAGGFEPIKPGTYEAVITEVEVKTFGTGSQGIKATLTIRDDVDQQFQKRKIFDNLVLTDSAMFKFQQYAKAVGMPEGYSPETLEEMAGNMKFKAVKVKISNETYETNSGEERIQDRVDFVDIPTVPYGGQATAGDPFNAPGMAPPDASNPILGGGQAPSSSKPPWEQQGSADPFADDGKPIDISEDDLPF